VSCCFSATMRTRLSLLAKITRPSMSSNSTPTTGGPWPGGFSRGRKIS
jgi:hypothetical protein